MRSMCYHFCARQEILKYSLRDVHYKVYCLIIYQNTRFRDLVIVRIYLYLQIVKTEYNMYYLQLNEIGYSLNLKCKYSTCHKIVKLTKTK